VSDHHVPHARSTDASRALGFGLLTVSDTRHRDDDVSGRVMRELVVAAGHRVHAAAIVPDEPDAVRARVLEWAVDPECQTIVTSGGTGNRVSKVEPQP
jgi:molybdenum cofactor biosynthesis protein B